MAPKKWLGVGAECTVSLCFLHPKDKIAEKIPNQTKSQKLSVLVVQERVEKAIRRKATQCVMFRHEDFSGQLLWCMEKYIKVDVEGPEETFFDAIPGEAMQGQEQAMQSNNNGGGGGGGGEGKVTYGEFLDWLGLWFLMGTIIGPPRHDFWSIAPITAFSGAPLHLGVWMS